MRLDALDVSYDVIRSLRVPVSGLRTQDPKLGAQMRAAASSISLNLAERNRRAGKDRLHHWRIATGSADELRSALRVAVSWGDIEEQEIAPALHLLDRVLATLWRLTH